MSLTDSDVQGMSGRAAGVGAVGFVLLAGAVVALAVLVPGFLVVSNVWRGVLAVVMCSVLAASLIRMFRRLGDQVLTRVGASRRVFVVSGIVARFVGAVIGISVGLQLLGPGSHLPMTPVVLAALLTGVDVAVGAASHELRD